ncbi:hypothetical protein H0I76_18850 [Limibaculum sp. M0105]|uniref:PNPLA domain-containing protein n=1 Tax=Thermohalobaculum xanthum TaxID=2753746 RepID=A0A8J7M9L4_9RHOB|nr:hypothetical protein [Thermohalobaculum xanthum]MBK0401261.1 hypothetical protein [Thermohalobaculum xanthum]
MPPISPSLAPGAAGAALLLVLEASGIPVLRAISAHWPLFLPPLVMMLGMAGVLGRGVGLHNIFREDPELAKRYRATHGIGIWRYSPAIAAQAALCLSMMHAWGFAFALGAGEGPDGLKAAAPWIVACTSASAAPALICAVLPRRGGPTHQPGERTRSLLGAVLGQAMALAALACAVRIEAGLAAAFGTNGAWSVAALAVPGALGCAVALAHPNLLPALALASLATLMSLVYAALAVLPEAARPLVLAGLFGWIVLANGGLDRLRGREPRLKFEIPGIVDAQGQSRYALGRRLDLRRVYAEPLWPDGVAAFRAGQRAAAPARQTEPSDPRRARPGLIAPLAALDAWAARAAPRPFAPPREVALAPEEGIATAPIERALRAVRERPAQGSRAGKPKLVLVATSGGAYRASFWTGIVLDALGALERAGALPGFTASVRLITGASGGMVGGAYFAAMARPDAAPSSVVARLESDILEVQDAAGPHALGYPQATRCPIPRDSLSAVAQRLVQRDLPGLMWPGVARTDRGTVLEDQWATLDRPFVALRQGEAEGWRPSLILSPMLTETGQPLMISNLDLDLVRRDAYGETVQFFDWFPEAQESFRLKTAVRLNAAFPYVAPAAALPTLPYRRVVDAGYYDNYGVDLAATYLARPEIRDWMLANTSGVIVLQLRAFPFALPLTAQPGVAGRALQWLTTPAEAVMAARGATMTFRNSQSLRQVRLDYRDRAAPDLPPEARPDFVESLTFVVDSRTSLSWYLPGHELDEMRAAFRAAPTQELLGRLVGAWWR